MALVAVLAFAALSGCGGDDGNGADGAGGAQAGEQGGEPAGGQAAGEGNDGGGGGDGRRSSKQELIAAADEICRRAQTKLSRVLDEYLTLKRGSGGKANIYREAVTDALIPELEAQVRAIRALSGPPEAERAADRLTAKMERIVEVARANPVRYASGPGKVVDQAEATAEELGFARCGAIV
jgi:hypothetical protein